jgi:hypothetical protein
MMATVRLDLGGEMESPVLENGALNKSWNEGEPHPRTLSEIKQGAILGGTSAAWMRFHFRRLNARSALLGDAMTDPLK